MSSLSPQEKSIIELSADSLTYPQIGQQIGLAAGTVKNKAKQLLDSMGADNMNQAIAMAFRQGIIQ